MVPVVALVGRPNVGKSTLFNRLTRTRDALVADFPGLTRDRKYGRAEVEGREFICIDTGGIDGTEDGVETRMAEQSLLAIEEADIVLFMVDARAGLMPADTAIAKHLRSREKPTFLVANKTDGIDADQAACGIQQRSTGIAGVDGRVGLDQVFNASPAAVAVACAERSVERRNDTTGQRPVEAEGVADGEDFLTDAQVVTCAERNRRWPLETNSDA